MPALDADLTIVTILRGAGFTVGYEMPAYPASKAPFLFLQSLPGDRWPGAWEAARYGMSSWDTSRKKARDQWLDAADALRVAWLEGRLNFADTRDLPIAVPSGIDGLHRFDGDIAVTVRA